MIPTRVVEGPSSLISKLSCMHDSKTGRIIVNKYLELPGYKGVFALGGSIMIDPNTGNPYPPTAQHQLGEGRQ